MQSNIVMKDAAFPITVKRMPLGALMINAKIQQSLLCFERHQIKRVKDEALKYYRIANNRGNPEAREKIKFLENGHKG